MNIGDLFYSLRADGALLQKDVAKEGEKAGEVFSASFQGKLTTSLASLAGFGAAAKLGSQGLVALEHGIADIIDLIPNMIHQGEDFALLVDDIADKTGASAVTASRFAGSLQYLGISTAGLGLSLKSLSGDIVNSEDKLNKLGIATRDSNGNLLDTITVLNNVRSYLSGAADGAAKLTLASDLLGKGAGTLVDYLNLTDEQAAALNKTLDGLGVTIGEKARHDAEDLAREQNLLSLAFQGFANTLATEVAPIVRAVVGGITKFIKDNGAQIRAVIVDITQAVAGFVSGLTGLDLTDAFQTQLDGLGNSAKGVTLSFEQWAQQTGRTIPVLDKAKVSTKANTDAIDKLIEANKAAVTAEEKRRDSAFALIDAQIAQLDLSEKQIAIDERKRGLNEDLNQAQLDLAKALTGNDAEAISGAMAKVADIQASQAENTRKLGVDAQRDALQLQRDEIDAKSQARQDELQGLRDQLDKQRAAIKAVNAGQVDDNKGKLATLKAQYNAYLSEQTTATKDHVGLIEAQFAGDPKTGTGLGSITKAFTDGQAAGKEFLVVLGQIGDALSGIIDYLATFISDFGKFVDELKTAADLLGKIGDIGKPVPGEHGFVSEAMTKEEYAAKFKALTGRDPTPKDYADHARGIDPPGFDKGPAAGQRFDNVPKPPLVVPPPTPPSLPGMSGFMSGAATVQIPVYLDGRVIANSTARILADDFHH